MNQLPENAVLVDVRSPAEYFGGHIKGAHNIPLDTLSDKFSTLNLSNDTPVVLYCASGARASVAESLLARMGYNNVTNAGGAQALVHLGVE